MFLLRRKSDGKFWRNRSGFSSWKTEKREGEWVDDPAQCKPFATEAAAMRSRACYGRHPHPRPTTNDKAAWDSYYRLTHEWFDKKNAPARKAYWAVMFECVPVEIRKVPK